MSKSVRITEKNPRAIKDAVKSVSAGMEVHIGIQGKEGEKVEGGITVLELGIIHEFGLGHVPSRSWLRGWFDSSEARFVGLIQKGMTRVIAGEIPMESLANALGLKGVAEIQERISAGIPPALKAETVRQKKSSIPLIDTGVLRASITFRVVPKGGQSK